MRHAGRHARMLPRAAAVLAYAIAAIATARVWEYSHDEGVTWEQALGSFEVGPELPVRELYPAIDAAPSRTSADVFEALRESDAMHPPAYYLAFLGWTGLAGSGRIPRLLPMLGLGVAALFGIRRLAHELAGGGRAGDWAMLMAALSPWFVGFSVLARPYFLALCLAIGSTNVALVLAERPRQRGAAAGFALLSIVGLYTVYHYVFVLAWQLAFLSLRVRDAPPGDRPAALGRLAALAAVIAAGFAPWLPFLVRHQAATSAERYFSGLIPPERWLEAAGHLLSTFALAEAKRAYAADLLERLLAVAAVLSLPPLLYAVRTGWRTATPLVRRFWVTVPLLPCLVIAGDLLQGAHTIAYSKNCFGWFPVLLLIVVGAWNSVPRPALRRAGLAAWCALLAVAVVANLWTRDRFRNPYERVAAHLRAHDEEGHLVILNATERGYWIPMLLTLRDAGVQRTTIAVVGGNELQERVDAAIDDPRIGLVTAINLTVYHHPVLMWSEELLGRVVGRARGRRWQAAMLRPGRLDGLPKRERHHLLVVTPTEVNYWSM